MHKLVSVIENLYANAMFTPVNKSDFVPLIKRIKELNQKIDERVKVSNIVNRIIYSISKFVDNWIFKSDQRLNDLETAAQERDKSRFSNKS